jgi:hypothetical protein
MRTPEPPVVEALARAHESLLDDLRKLEEVTGQASGEGLAELRVRLGATREHLARHFRFEEQNGYMEAVRKREPRLGRAIEQLAGEHSQLLQTLEAVIAEAGVATRLGEALREGVRQWAGSVREHEARENELVQDTFNLDIGAEV